MNDIQKKELEILNAFTKVCEEHGLRYFADGGTAIGAVRHKGFIPWDDDIDVLMPREDYDKLASLKEPFGKNSKYFIQTYKTDPCYPLHFMKIRDSSTTFIENVYTAIRMNHGVWIDIFPLDNYKRKDKPIPESSWRPSFILSWATMFYSFFFCFRRKFHKKTFFRDLGLNFIALLFFWTGIFHYPYHLFEAFMKRHKNKDTKYLTSYCTNYPSHNIFLKEWFKKPIKVPFEDSYVYIANGNHEYLTYLFGDYMTPPPVDKQIGHHYNKGLDLTKPYTEYVK